MSRASAPQPLNLDALLPLSRPDRRWGCQILDIRSAPAARRGHLPGSAWLPVCDPQQLDHELAPHLLPAKGSRIVVVSDDARESRYVALHLYHRGFAASYLDGPLAGISLEPGPAPGALWTPDPYLLEHVRKLPKPTLGPVLDLGAGNGRNAVFLACRGHDALAIDRLQDALDLAHDRARHHGVNLQTHQANLKTAEDVPGGSYACVLMIRFLEKDLLTGLRGLVRPGGVLVIHTYALRETNGSNGSDSGSGPKKGRYLLSAAEAHEALPESEWEYLHRSRAFFQPNKTMIGLVARRLG